MSQSIRTEVRLQLLRASDQLRSAAKDIDDALDCIDTGGVWVDLAVDAKIAANVAADHIQTARGMALVTAMSHWSVSE
jgi:hypothetical protein